MKDPFSFTLHTNLKFGAGEVRKLPEHAAAFGWKRIALVVDSGVAKNPVWQAVAADLRKQFELGPVIETAVTEPTYSYLDEVLPPFRATPFDALITVGGGSVLDLGKALSSLAVNLGPAVSYRGFDMPKVPGPPVVAIPTTAGTGSEVTPSAVFIDTAENRKFGINTAIYLPKMCILDPTLLTTCPRSVTISSGMDAIVHCHESFVSKKATPITRMFAIEGFGLVFNALPTVVNSPGDVDAWGRMQLGAMLAATALFNSSAGPAGALSYPLGVNHHVPHGLAGAVFLPWIVQHNVDRGYFAYKPLFDRIDGAPSLSEHDASEAFAKRIWDLASDLSIPRRLDGFGLTRDRIPAFVEQATWLKGAFDLNPIPFSLEDVRSLLETMTAAS